MPAPAKRSFETPDERFEVPGILADVVELADSTISRVVYQPGTHCPQISFEGKATCSAHHTGLVLQGKLHIEMGDGSTLEVGPNEVFDIPGGHDGWAVGDDPLLAVSWAGFRSWMPERTGDRVLLTLVFTDIVGSTGLAVSMGDDLWTETLARHYRGIRSILDRFRGREVTTVGDGLLAAFDGAARAIDAAVAMRDRAFEEGLAIRIGAHSGEVEVAGDDLRGVTVHEAARIAAAAGPNEILVSDITRLLAGGASARFESRGPHELKGFSESRELFAVADEG
ncbi:MAG TPA: adenylate/guanylate cyclase domain-containing protein [Acidimicrobiia bacterium]|nr:adenylate/guanylate cyclase domain-containing protein [Acidimicrobiia bacterium]